MANNPISVSLPADLPTDWAYGQTVGPNGTDVGLSEQHGYNYLMEQVNAAQTAANEVGQAVGGLQPQTIYSYTHQKSGTVNALTGAEGAAYISWVMTANYEYGDTWNLNGEPVTIQYCDGNPILPHSLIGGDMLVGKISGSIITLTIPTPKPNENLLDNWYFVDPINQRGKSEYTSSGYTIDRWHKTSANGILTLNDGYITLSGSSAYAYFRQMVGDINYPVTLSVMTEEGNIYSSTLRNDGGFYIGTFYVYTEDGYVVIRFPSDTTSVNIKALKLEPGIIQTLAKVGDDGKCVLFSALPNKATELLKCQRYYLPLGRDALGSGTTATNNMVYIMVPIPIQMASTPTAVFPDTVTVKYGKTVDGFTYTGNLVLYPNSVRLQFSAPEGTQVENGLTACAYTSSTPYLTAEL